MSMHPITVSPTKNANGVFEWTLSYGKQSGNHGHYPTIHLKTGGTNERFVITLVDSTYGITFSDDPLWIKVGAYPTEPGIDCTQIDKFESSDTIVKFRDLNEHAGVSVWYRLNFTVPGVQPGQPGTFLDPEIRNGGGGGPGVNKFLTLAGVAGAVAAAFLAYELLFKKY